MERENKLAISGYSKYNPEAKMRKKISPLDELYPPLPRKQYDVIYADPPWDYGGKMQYDKSSIKTLNIGFKRDIFISAAEFKYPTLKLKDLKTLDVASITAPDCLLFLWATGPQAANAIQLGEAWGFEYKTVAFVWDKQVHNPGRYTLSQTEFVFAFKKGKFPSPRGARNVRQLVSVHRTEHSKKPAEVIEGITRMFPDQRKIELFARSHYADWDNWGLEAPDGGINAFRGRGIDDCDDLYLESAESKRTTLHALSTL
ncbi:MAG: hypothetical protein II818_00335 [Aeriscardovia sp.]|nr:hypothetical protein [Aeriscardovia sp.]